MKAFRSSSAAGVALSVAGVALALSAGVNAQVRVDVTPLVTDDPAAHAAQITDGALVNAWGLSYSPTSPFWVSSNGMDLATLYSVGPATQATAKVGLTVNVPVGGVTGQVFDSADQQRSVPRRQRFVFAGEGGAVAGLARRDRHDGRDAAAPGTRQRLQGQRVRDHFRQQLVYTANFRRGTIDVLKGANGEPDLAGRFTDSACRTAMHRSTSRTWAARCT